ncbi:MAG: hypothetical protein ACQEUD_02165 [Bacillota bacterium]
MQSLINLVLKIFPTVLLFLLLKYHVIIVYIIQLGDRLLKKILAYVLFTLLISSGCSNENEIKELPAVSHNSIEELKTWSPTARTAIELEGKSLNLYGEIGKYALSPDVIRVDTQGKHTWYLWMKPEEKKELLHEKVTIKGISEKDKNEEIYLADTK